MIDERKKILSPLEAEILLWYYRQPPCDYDLGEREASTAFNLLIKHKLLEQVNTLTHPYPENQITDRGKVLVGFWLETPLPVKVSAWTVLD